MKKLTAFLLMIINIATCFNVFASTTYDSADSIIESGYIESEKTGNIFSLNDKNITFSQSLKNNISESAYIYSTYKVFTEKNELVKEYPARNIEITAGNETIIEYTIENPEKYGLYTLKIENSITVNDENYRKTFEEGFSVCIDLNKNNAEPNFGFAQHIVSKGFGDADVTPNLMRKAGASWYREDCLLWADVEKSRGNYSLPAGAKEKLQKIKDSGLKIVCLLNGTNGIYSSSFPAEDSSHDAFASYCRYVATELEGIVDHYEIWNEWNLKKESDSYGYYTRTDLYAKVLKKAYKAVKSVNENNTVIGCVTAGIKYDWIDSVFTYLNGEKAMDAVSIHCYPWTENDGVNENEFINETLSLKSVLEKHEQNIPLWITEIGFSTYKSNGETIWLAPCTREEQLNSLVLVNAINKTYGLYDKLIQYSFHDRANNSSVEYNWGLINCWQRGLTDYPEAELTPYGAKPAYLGIATMNYFTGGNTEYKETIKDDNDRAYMLKFANHNLRKNVMLCINGNINTPTRKTVTLDTKKVKIYDKYGNFTGEQISETGSFSFNVSAEPMYVTWTIDGVSDEDDNENFLNVGVYTPTNTVTINGTAEMPGDLVSVLVVSKGKELSSYNPARTLFVGQVKADSNSKYSVSFVMPKLEGQFEVYANSKERMDKQKGDLVFSYNVPEIKVMQNKTDIYEMSKIDFTVPVDIELRGFTDLTDEKPVLMIAQYSGKSLIFVEYANEAIGDCTMPGSEIKKSFEVKNGVDNIKVMYMNISKAKPFVASYVIK